MTAFMLYGTGAWERSGEFYITKSTVGPQSAEAIIFWTEISGGGSARACGQWWGSPEGGVAQWARQASAVPGTELVEGPLEVTIDGYAAQHVVFTVLEDVACGRGFFHTWRSKEFGAELWSGIEVGDTVRIWLIEVDDTVLFIEGDTYENAGADLGQEVEEIVASMVLRG